MSFYNKYRYKGKWVSESVYKHKLTMAEAGRRRKKIRAEENISPQRVENVETDRANGLDVSLSPEDVVNDEQQPDYLEGRRIVELSELGRNLWCVSCKEALSLTNIENEFRRGLGSTLSVRCHKCLVLNSVCTGKTHESSDGRKIRFDMNSQIVLGIMRAGAGWTYLNKMLSCLNVPTITFRTYKRYENEIGTAEEEVARKSCKEAAAQEKALSIDEAANIEKLLPDNS